MSLATNDSDSINDGLAVTTITDILVPVYSDATAIKWDDNDATIEGILHEVGKHYENTGPRQNHPGANLLTEIPQLISKQIEAGALRPSQ